ncbi:MAG: glycosyltransferase family 4 protein [Candidatus Marinimicrobia bacterium]|nr:glycosyltransferase family 4 protein [Candidatus Neomarinimicrobiota bacterium]
MAKLEILIFLDYYLPGYKAGGPIRTLSNIIDQLGNEFRFKIITRDRDAGDSVPYSGIMVNTWNSINKADVFYLSKQKFSLGILRRLIQSVNPDIIYLNSFFSPVFTIKPLFLRRLRLIPNIKVIVAPRGEFSLGALAIKSFKKYIYLAVAKMLGLYRGVVWQASSEYEKEDICHWFKDYDSVIVAPNLASPFYRQKINLSNHRKVVGSLKIIFLSRVAKKKNLIGVLGMLERLNGKVLFNIYGPLEDKDYWVECRKIIKRLPNNIRVQYIGAVEHDQVEAVIKEHDLFFLPTLGENFGHVILESLVTGCPVLISDQTPWRDLEEKGVGWDLPLNRREKFHEVLQRCIDMNEQEYNILSKRAHKFGLKTIEDKTALNLNRELFYKAFYCSN